MNLKVMFNYIKNFFNKKEDNALDNDNINNDKIINEEQELLVVDVKEEVNNIRNLNINWDLINKLKDYDIVWVKMTDEEIKRDNIIDNHQLRPFLLVEKKEDDMIVKGYYFTSNISNNWFFKNTLHSGLKLVLNKDNYSLVKNSLVLFHEKKELPYENIMHFSDHLLDSDLNKLNKYSNLLKNRVVISDKTFNVIEIGDVIMFHGTNYIIYQIDNTNIYGYPIYITFLHNTSDVLENPNYFSVDKNSYYVDYKNYKVFSRNDTLYITYRFNDSIIDTIKENKKIVKAKRKKKQAISKKR